MNMREEIILANNVKLDVRKKSTDENIELLLLLKSSDECLLHWGLRRTAGAPWHMPPAPFRPEGSIEYDRSALQTPFTCSDGECRLLIAFDRDIDFSFLSFALYFPDEDCWDNNGGRNYSIALPVTNLRLPLPIDVLKAETEGKDTLFLEEYNLGDDDSLAAALIRQGKQFEVMLASNIQGPLMLHWGAAMKSSYDWSLPPEYLWPARSKVYDDKAVRTPFTVNDGLNRLSMSLEESNAPLGITFVLKVTDEERWLMDGKGNFFVPVADRKDEEYSELASVIDEIIHGETGDHGWTLMHRFNLCHDLLDKVKNNIDGLAMIYVWMRFSVLRQLDWQRNYNTQPRELSHAQDRLTLKIADNYRSEPQGRELLRMIMSTLGRGGEGQKIRDEILHIMHRHHIKEVSGHFMEEWHQKLHNNTTPDDIVICEAYLEFMRSGGKLDHFYETLEAGGVTRKRLESFERPITTPPDFVPHLKDALIYDFENYLKLLKSIHSGTDLESAINAAGYLSGEELGGLLSYIWQHRDAGGSGIADYIKQITGARRILRDRLNVEQDSRRVRDMIFLDLALEGYTRVVIERSIHEKPEGDQLAELTGMVLENVRFSYDTEELSESNSEWYHLQNMPRFSKDWSLHAKAVLERVGRGTGQYVDHYYQLFQSKAEYLGKAFSADSWTVTLFTEEVVRGMPAFVLSMLIRHLEPLLRKHAKLGDWQVISPGRTAGWLEVVESLGSVQGRHYDRPSIIIAEKVRGDEEPPEGATAIITPDAVDLVSHIAVRARNAHLLFASCYDEDCLTRLKSLKGHMLNFRVNVSGDVEYEEAEEAASAVASHEEFTYERQEAPQFSAYALLSKDFNARLVGGKSLNLMHLEHKLPDWIHLPVSAALPFGIFEKVLSLDINREISGQYEELLARIDEKPEDTLSDIRRSICGLQAPEELKAELLRAMDNAGLNQRGTWDDTWMCIKRVWASKWNERAYLSRNARKMRHEDIFMAVLVQEVVNAEYAFVIHTANPFTQDRDELYAEVVPGLGETLVGNYPGRSLSFVSKKDVIDPEILSYPSKGAGLFGGGLIFRSDSNGEDLPGYAGAGLYDSIMAEPPRETTLNYTKDALVWNDDFKKEFMTAVTKIGIAVEENFKSPQDIEGAYVNGKYYVVQTRPQVGL
jgi:alpha-glucan,water dikinase